MRIIEATRGRKLVLASGLGAVAVVALALTWFFRARGYAEVAPSLRVEVAPISQHRTLARSAVPPSPPSPAPRAPKPIAAEDPEPPEYEDPLFGEDVSSEPRGLALFPPLGTDPPRQGVIVPDDFELPEGYVRHYQATDDGDSLPAILMLHPDYQIVDARGVPLAVPESRVLPPELAPAGMPIRMLELAESEPSLEP